MPPKKILTGVEQGTESVDTIDTNEENYKQLGGNLINIEAFFGDPSQLAWFLTQVKEIKTINRWDDRTALFFLKTKLKGTAQTFFQNSPSCKNLESFDEALKLLENFFGDKTTPSSAIAAFNAIRMFPTESIKNYGYRIEIAAHAAYKFVIDQGALNTIKSIHLLNTIPESIRTQLVFEDQSDFHKLISKASHIQEFQNSSKQTENNASINAIQTTTEVSELQKEVRQLTTLVKDLLSTCQLCGQVHKTDQCPKLKNQNNEVTCQFCQKKGHVMPKCYLFLRQQNHNRGRFNNSRGRGHFQNHVRGQFNPNSQQPHGSNHLN